MSASSPPEGFSLFPPDGTFSDAMAPMYYCIDGDGTRWGLLVEQKHSNMMGMCHGGVLMTLMDYALSAEVCHRLGKFTGTPTISMSFDFLEKAVIGDWIYADVEVLKLTNTMGFAQGIVRRQDGTALMRASGSFKLPKDLSQAAGVTLDELLGNS